MDSDLQSVLPIFAAVAKRPDVAAAICAAAAKRDWVGQATVAGICSASHLPLSRQGDVTSALKAGVPHGLFKQHSPLTWSASADPALMARLASMLTGAAAYIETVYRDADEVDVVLTKPARPSELERALREANYESVGLIATGEVFTSMAAGAQSAFTVMTPFVDELGAQTLVHLFEKTSPAVRRMLVIRSTPTGLPEAFLSASAALAQLGVRVLDYRLEREGGGFETFHAKVVLADRHWAYVGSSNMNQWSLAYSMELGVSLKGRSAARIARVIDALSKVALPVRGQLGVR